MVSMIHLLKDKNGSLSLMLTTVCVYFQIEYVMHVWQKNILEKVFLGEFLTWREKEKKGMVW